MARVKKPKKVKEFNFERWFISQLRSICRRYPPYYSVKNAHKEVYYLTTKSGKQVKRVRFPCVKCGQKYDNKNTFSDHIVPVVGIDGLPRLKNGKPDWNEYIDNMYFLDEKNVPKKDSIQLMCRECHNEKTQAERAARREQKLSLADTLSQLPLSSLALSKTDIEEMTKRIVKKANKVVD